MSQTLLAMAKDLVMAQIAAHRLSPEEMRTALQQTYASLKPSKPKKTRTVVLLLQHQRPHQRQSTGGRVSQSIR
jgi:hypothetical protein